MIQEFYLREGFLNGQVVPQIEGYSCYSTSQQFLWIPKSLNPAHLGHGEHPLAHGHRWDDMINSVGLRSAI